MLTIIGESGYRFPADYQPSWRRADEAQSPLLTEIVEAKINVRKKAALLSYALPFHQDVLYSSTFDANADYRGAKKEKLTQWSTLLASIASSFGTFNLALVIARTLSLKSLLAHQDVDYFDDNLTEVIPPKRWEYGMLYEKSPEEYRQLRREKLENQKATLWKLTLACYPELGKVPLSASVFCMLNKWLFTKIDSAKSFGLLLALYKQCVNAACLDPSRVNDGELKAGSFQDRTAFIHAVQTKAALLAKAQVKVKEIESDVLLRKQLLIIKDSPIFKDETGVRENEAAVSQLNTLCRSV